MPRHSGGPKTDRLSRRDFAQAAALAAATLALPQPALAQASVSAQGAGTQASQASPDGEAQVQVILAKHGKRLSDEQKADVRRLAAQAQKTSDTLRLFPLDNSDEPAMTFHIYRSDR